MLPVDFNLADNTSVESKLPLDNPNSYGQHATLLYNYAARYGSEEVSANKLTLSSKNQDKKDFNTGTKLVKYYENWNEPDATWLNKSEYFYAPEFAAMTSKDYDNHQDETQTVTYYGRIGRH